METAREFIINSIQEFLDRNLDPARPILLGFSGGCDSTALLYLLIEQQKKRPFPLLVAHVDHGWRAESAHEADQLKNLCEKLGLPYFSTRLSPPIHGNWEDAARQMRLKFFEEIYREKGCQALLLGHHADDQVETVLKRLFEGAGIFALSGLKEISFFQGMALWRPLLSVQKKQLESWLEKRGITDWVIDSSNRDERFLRSRMRETLIPELSKLFGKNIQAPLLQFGEMAGEIGEYFEPRLQAILDQRIKGPFGEMIDLSDTPSLEIKLLLRLWLGSSLSTSLIEQITNGLVTQAADLTFSWQNQLLIVDRGVVFLLSDPIPPFSLSSTLEPGIFLDGHFEWTLSFEDFCRGAGWKSLFAGSLSFMLPRGKKYRLASPENHFIYPGSSRIDEWWSKNKVPAFLRRFFPLILDNENVVHELLTGRRILPIEPDEVCMTLKIRNLDNSKTN